MAGLHCSRPVRVSSSMVTVGQLDHALVRHFELHLTQRVPLVIADGFVVTPEAQCVRECCLNKFLGALPRRLLVMRAGKTPIAQYKILLSRVAVVPPQQTGGRPKSETPVSSAWAISRVRHSPVTLLQQRDHVGVRKLPKLRVMRSDGEKRARVRNCAARSGLRSSAGCSSASC